MRKQVGMEIRDINGVNIGMFINFCDSSKSLMVLMMLKLVQNVLVFIICFFVFWNLC